MVGENGDGGVGDGVGGNGDGDGGGDDGHIVGDDDEMMAVAAVGRTLTLVN